METIQGSEPQLRVPGKAYVVTPLGYPAEMLGRHQTYERVTDEIGDVPLKHPHQKLWLAGFGVAFPSSFFLMGASLSVSWSYMRLLCPDLLAQASLSKSSAIVVLLWQALLLIGWAWTGGFVVGSISKRTLWASTLLCYSPCLICLSQFRAQSLPRTCLLLFLLPAIWGAHRGFRISRMKFSSALVIALALTIMIVPTWSSSRLQTLSPQNVMLNWALSLPAWYLVFTGWRRGREREHAHA